VRAADVAVINLRHWPTWALAIFYAVFGMSLPLTAAILPEERLDILYHRYDGDGVTVDGPSILGRKSVGKNTSVYANYYTDAVSSASIDVRTFASPYTEDRTEYSYGVDFVFDNSTMALGYTNSEENDYTSNTYHFGIGHTAFGDLTTVDLGVSFSDDEVRQNQYDNEGNFIGNNPDFGENGKAALDRRSYKLGLTQIFTKNLIMNFAFEAVSDEGFTQNPYRNAIIAEPGGPIGGIANITNESYPETRTSDAFAIRANYFLPYRAALKLEYKYYKDSWDIEAHTYKIAYTHPFRDRWVFDFHYRVYQQDQASFYFDLLPENSGFVYQGRDKELSTFNSQGIGFGMSYEFLQSGWWQFNKASVSFAYEHVNFDYDNFTDFDEGDPGNPNPNFGQSFSFDAEVIELYFSVWY
jgi:hypothetical protein